MKITAETKISRILKEKPEALEAIISLSKHFNKLRNPLLRKVLASRVSVRQAAEIGNTDLRNFLAKMEEVGFEVDFGTDSPVLEDKRVSDIGTYHYELDVRPILDTGADPFVDIMDALKKLQIGERLLLITPFPPLPLIALLGEKGFVLETFKKGEELYDTIITKKTKEADENVGALLSEPENEFDHIMLSAGSNIEELDVRHLEMPEPMVKILDAVSHLPEGYILLVHHKKMPQFLLPELKKRGFLWVTKPADGGLELLIYRN